MYTYQFITALRGHCKRIGVKAPEGFWAARSKDLAAAYNGIGPEAWNPGFRSVVTWLLSPFSAAALPHDWAWSQQEKSYGRFTKSNLEFAYNAWREALWQKRIALIPMGVFFALLCQIFGWKGYRGNDKL